MKYICRALLVLAAGCLANGQFMPQSHLGRLVQSITSPLMPFNGDYRDNQQADAGYPAEGAGYYGPGRHMESSGPQTPGANNQEHETTNLRQEASRMDELTGRQLAMMQSQQRGVPQNQHYGYGNNLNQQRGPFDNQNADDEQAAPIRGRHMSSSGDQDNEDAREKVGVAPSRNNEQRNGPDEQMGAYLGPSIDDKEIQGAFNSNNEDRDDDDGPSSYDGPSNSQARDKAASQPLGLSESNFGQEMGFGPSSSQADGDSFGPQRPGARSGAGPMDGSFRGSNYDEDSVDEDEQPAARPVKPAGRRTNQRPQLNQAASQFQKQASYPRSKGPRSRAAGNNNNGGQMLAAANGYAPFGYAGPVELAGVINSLAGGDPNAGYQIYGPAGDGSFAPGANYYQQQGQGQGRRKASASADGYGQVNDGYGAAPMGRPHGNQRHRANNDNDDHDEADDD